MKTNWRIRKWLEYNESGKRVLMLLMQENTVLKTRLADMMSDHQVTREVLEEVEHYHNALLRQDELIHLMRHDMSQFDKLLEKSAYHSTADLNLVAQRCRRLRREVNKLRRSFYELEVRFVAFARQAGYVLNGSWHKG